jgi:hypothetical protein
MAQYRRHARVVDPTFSSLACLKRLCEAFADGHGACTMIVVRGARGRRVLRTKAVLACSEKR